jgi:hypothetical protein
VSILTKIRPKAIVSPYFPGTDSPHKMSLYGIPCYRLIASTLIDHYLKERLLRMQIEC